jgi:hypothetical protein
MSRSKAIVLALLAASLAILVFGTLGFAWEPQLRAWRPGILHGWGPAAGTLGPLERLGAAAAGLASQYLAGVLLLYLAPRRVARVAAALGAGRDLLRHLLLGALIVVGLSALAVLSMLSAHTFPLPFLLLGALFLAALGGVVAITFRLGRDLAARAGWAQASPLTHLAMGSLVIFALTRVPYLGVVVLILIWLTGAGVAAASRFGSRAGWTLAPLVEDVHS